MAGLPPAPVKAAPQQAVPAQQDPSGRAAAFLQSEFAQQFDDPKFRKAAMDYDKVLNSGEQVEGTDAAGMYEFANQLFSRELKKGVGDKLPDGGVIESKRIVRAFIDGNKVVLELDIRGKKPDGTTFDYRAPVTKNRSSDETDEVLKIPLDQIRDRIRGAKYLAQAIEQAGGREQALQQILSAAGEQEQPAAPAPPQMGA